MTPEPRHGEAQEDAQHQKRAPEISRGASVVSARPVVREKLLGLQRSLGRSATRGAVLEGRDIGTVVFPDAEVKIFVTAAPEIRARRRAAELDEAGEPAPFTDVLADILRRDRVKNIRVTDDR